MLTADELQALKKETVQGINDCEVRIVTAEDEQQEWLDDYAKKVCPLVLNDILVVRKPGGKIVYWRVEKIWATVGTKHEGIVWHASGTTCLANGGYPARKGGHDATSEVHYTPDMLHMGSENRVAT